MTSPYLSQYRKVVKCMTSHFSYLPKQDERELKEGCVEGRMLGCMGGWWSRDGGSEGREGEGNVDVGKAAHAREVLKLLAAYAEGMLQELLRCRSALRIFGGACLRMDL